ncbi:MAG: TolC family protein [Bacteroidota bacterium]|nr:TolC family protein [Bacteroidota bacterium]
MKRITLTIISFFIICSRELPAQTKAWTLEDCINYAVENNIQLQRQKLLTNEAEVDLTKARLSTLPSLNLGSDASIRFGRSVDPVTNLITFKQNISNSFSLNSSFQLFSGFAGLNTISASKFMLKAGIESEKVARNTLIINILGAYYQVLYAKGLENAAKKQLDLSEKQLFRIEKTVETGREPVARKYEMESRASDDRLSFTVARNNASKAVTSLKQLLQLEPGTEFDVLMPELEDTLIPDVRYNTDSVYNIASQTLPRLKAINYELMASRKQVAAAWGGFFPSIQAGGSLFTGFYKVIGEGVGDQASFSSQLKNNNSQALGVSLNIPLFNNYTAGRNLRMARLRKQDNELKLQLEKNALYTEIENACLDYNRGKDEYSAAASNLEYNKKSFDAVEKKFEAGIIDVIEYSTAKTTLFRAQTEELRTKLQLIIRQLTIQFYTTGEYEKLINK